MKKHPVLMASFAAASLSLLVGSSVAAESLSPIKKEKLQIVFCFGQSNMVGLAAVPTAWLFANAEAMSITIPKQ